MDGNFLNVVRVVVFKFPEDETKDFIKRVIGMPGDIVEIQNKNVLINGIPLDDKSYTQRIDPNIIDRLINSRDNFGPVTVPATHYFVLGDNRDQSLDSRFGGLSNCLKSKGRRLHSIGLGMERTHVFDGNESAEKSNEAQMRKHCTSRYQGSFFIRPRKDSRPLCFPPCRNAPVFRARARNAGEALFSNCQI